MLAISAVFIFAFGSALISVSCMQEEWFVLKMILTLIINFWFSRTGIRQVTLIICRTICTSAIFLSHWITSRLFSLNTSQWEDCLIKRCWCMNLLLLNVVIVRDSFTTWSPPIWNHTGMKSELWNIFENHSFLETNGLI